MVINSLFNLMQFEIGFFDFEGILFLVLVLVLSFAVDKEPN